VASLKEQLTLKTAELSQLHTQFEALDVELGKMDEVARRYQEAQKVIGDQQKVIHELQSKVR